uniref:Uncharacterized protein n=1 Tax=Rhodosorus marinus TaxID=101924 RepID=A0A7S3E5R0_9RHOD|mmetsp:Transcript_11078/g.46249  ORF Transcript_11078/g.46249 Transcript_11078/m.46249 type:complete len:104 (+) Transcript_11078:407-718(+)
MSGVIEHLAVSVMEDLLAIVETDRCCPSEQWNPPALPRGEGRFQTGADLESRGQSINRTQMEETGFLKAYCRSTGLDQRLVPKSPIFSTCLISPFTVQKCMQG